MSVSTVTLTVISVTVSVISIWSVTVSVISIWSLPHPSQRPKGEMGTGLAVTGCPKGLNPC